MWCSFRVTCFELCLQLLRQDYFLEKLEMANTLVFRQQVRLRMMVTALRVLHERVE